MHQLNTFCPVALKPNICNIKANSRSTFLRHCQQQSSKEPKVVQDAEQQKLYQKVSQFGEAWAQKQSEELSLELEKQQQLKPKSEEINPEKQEKISNQQKNESQTQQKIERREDKEVISVQESKLVEGIDKSLRPEQFTLQKEEKRKQLGAEIISVDKNYKPKVQTWGVFPRPQNISKTFGGGRTIKPGQEYESDEERKQRLSRTQSALLKYRKTAGIIIDPEIQKKAQIQYDQGMELFNNGKLSQASDFFEQAVSLMAFGTSLGGQARLQYALCLDSLGRNEEALPLYKKLAKHPTSFVAKKSKQLLFGFDAMNSLKAYSMSYSIQKGAYDEYFQRFTGQWNNVYYSSVGEEENNTLATVFATTIMILPVLLVVVLAFGVPTFG
eukprot:TRINITY_DN2162_c0_g1_i2.p1 TRINITY_DN2162_c0_g1~~TRINITY_DN2162_c0_g1_i2.p1  ORF type:complete len:385 (+),score=62.90 TRINITY_DN2162_c0_g1_i2:47-1201(+)